MSLSGCNPAKSSDEPAPNPLCISVKGMMKAYDKTVRLEPLEQFLEHIAQRGSWFGGGSVAALCGAISAALLEKLIASSRPAQRVSRIRHECTQLIQRDARVFADVVEASRLTDRLVFQKALKKAIETPCRVFECAQSLQHLGRSARRLIKPQLQSDLRCAMAVASAAGNSARVLIQANLSWLNDRRYAKMIRRRLDSVTHRYGRSHA